MGKDDDKKHLKKLLEKARSGCSFGLCLDKAGGNPTVTFSATKTPEALAKQAKTEGGGTKTGMGKLSVVSGKLTFAFLDAPPSGVTKKLKTFFTESGVTTSIAVVGPDGKDVSENSEADAKAKLTVDFQALAAKVIKMPSGIPTLNAQVNDLTARMMALIQAKEFDAEAATSVFMDLQQLEKLAARIPAKPAAPEPPSTPPPPVALAREFKALQDKLQVRIANDREVAKQFKTLAGAFRTAMTKDNSDIDAARKVIAALGKIEQEVPDLPADNPFIIVNTDWIKSVDQAVGEVGKLRGVIAKAVEGMPGAGKVESAFAKLTQTLGKLADALSKALKAGVGKSGSEAGKAAELVIKTADQVEKILSGDPVLSKIDDNPFEKTKVVASLKATLKQVRDEVSRAKEQMGV